MKEVRSLTQEFRFTPNSRKVEGYALLFNKRSQDLGGFREIILPEALKNVLPNSDVLALYNHDEKRVLARNSFGVGTLTLIEDKVGLKYSFEAPDTSDGNDLLYHLRKGNIKNSSFAFNIKEGGEKYERVGKEVIRYITQFDKIWDVSPVWRPAYLETSVAVRSYSEFLLNEKDKKFNDYIKNLEDRINKLRKNN